MPRPTSENIKLDALDIAILRTFQHNTIQPARDIGDLIGLSAAAVQRRVKRMHKSGVIEALVAKINPWSVGLPVTVIVHVDIDREAPPFIDAFKAMMSGRPEVQQCWYTTGLTDFILVVRVATLAGYENFTREALTSHDNVTRFTSYVVLDEVKSGVVLDL